MRATTARSPVTGNSACATISGRATCSCRGAPPWRLLADADRSEQSLRFLLQHRLYGPCGLTDSAKWTTGAAEPYAVTARNDFWNTGLATMALLEWLDGPARLSASFAALPEVRTALDRVFPATPREQALNRPRISTP